MGVSGYFSSEASRKTLAANERLPLPNLRARKFDALGSARVLNAAHAADQVEGVPIQPAVLDVSIIHVNGNDFADHQAAAGRGRREIEDLMESAFETDR